MSSVLGRFRARRLLPRAMEPPPALGFLLPPSEQLPSCPVTPASPCLCRSLPSGLPAGTGERPLRRVGVPHGRRLSWGTTDLHANPGWEPGTAAGSGHPGWGAGFAELFLASPQLGSRPSARARPWPPGRPGRWAPTAGSTLPPAALCTWPAFRTPCPPLPGAALVTPPSKSVLPPPAATSSPLHALEPESP